MSTPDDYKRILDALLELLDEGVLAADVTGRVLAINEPAMELAGRDTPPERLDPNEQGIEVCGLDGEALGFQATPLGRALRGEDSPDEHLVVRWPDGRSIRVHAKAKAIRGDLGQVLAVVTTFDDLSPEQELRSLIKREERRYRALTELVSDYTFELEVDEDNRLSPVWVTDAFEEITGYSLEELLALGGIRALVLPADFRVVRQQMKAALTGQDYACELRIRTKDDEVKWMRSFTRPVFDEHQERVVRVLGAARDISDEKLLSPLTGLPNLNAYKDRIGVALERLGRSPGLMLAVAYIDFDHFHVVNQSLGYAAGDALLRAYADRLEACTRPGDSAAHLRGDEFSVLFTDLRYPDDALELAEDLLARIAEPVHVDGTSVVVTASMGLAFSEDQEQSAEELLRSAQTAASRARALGGGRFELYDPEMMRSMQERLRLEAALRRAVSQGELEVHYQPIVDLAACSLQGFEALVRWNDPDHGPVSPNVFIRVAEETGLIVPLGEYVLRESCQQLVDWHRRHPDLPRLTMSVNLSPLQVIQGDLLFRMDRVLRQTGLAPSRLRLEITESTLMRDPEAAIEMLEQVRARGVRVGVDDFGTGHSSLSLLHRFPVDMLKVDRAFVSELGVGEHAQGIVSTIVALARHLRLEVVAEGIETEDQAKRLVELGVRLGQGYLFSKPVPAELADDLIEELAGVEP